MPIQFHDVARAEFENFSKRHLAAAKSKCGLKLDIEQQFDAGAYWNWKAPPTSPEICVGVTIFRDASRFRPGPGSSRIRRANSVESRENKRSPRPPGERIQFGRSFQRRRGTRPQRPRPPRAGTLSMRLPDPHLRRAAAFLTISGSRVTVNFPAMSPVNSARNAGPETVDGRDSISANCGSPAKACENSIVADDIQQSR